MGLRSAFYRARARHRIPGYDALVSLVYRLYEQHLAASLIGTAVPGHVGVILDGNRRWAKAGGFEASEGHRAGGAKILEVLRWCEEAGVRTVTLWLLSTDNLTGRSPEELRGIFGISEDVAGQIAATGRWKVHPVGALDLLPASTARRLKELEDQTRDVQGLHVNIAIGYGGRREIADAVRSLLQAHAAVGTSIEELAEILDVEHIAEHLYTRGQPDPDLVIRTSGEQRVGGFLLWQSVHTEFSFVDTFWPDFRKVDFLRALRQYAQRERRFGA
jgi:short-chain Z-isoprenyl diphosphate synthase